MTPFWRPLALAPFWCLFGVFRYRPVPIPSRTTPEKEATSPSHPRLPRRPRIVLLAPNAPVRCTYAHARACASALAQTHTHARARTHTHTHTRTHTPTGNFSLALFSMFQVPIPRRSAPFAAHRLWLRLCMLSFTVCACGVCVRER